MTAEFAENPRVRFVEIRSPEYFKALATSKYLMNNSTFPQEFAKRPEQVYLNTWHGVPLKHMGYDMPGGHRPHATSPATFCTPTTSCRRTSS